MMTQWLLYYVSITMSYPEGSAKRAVDFIEISRGLSMRMLRGDRRCARRWAGLYPHPAPCVTPYVGRNAAALLCQEAMDSPHLCGELLWVIHRRFLHRP